MTDAETAQASAIDWQAVNREKMRGKLRYDAECKDAPEAVDNLIEMVLCLSDKLQSQEKEIALLRDVVDCALAANVAIKLTKGKRIDPNIDYFADRLHEFYKNKKGVANEN